MSKRKQSRVIDFLDQHGRGVLRKYFPQPRGCIPAARLVLEFCRQVNVTCKVVSVVCVVRNHWAQKLGIWPFGKVSELQAAHAKRAGAAFVVLGQSRTGHECDDPDGIDLHLVPIVAGRLVDLTLDAHTARPEYGFSPLPVIVLPWHGAGKLISADMPTDPPTSICYLEKTDNRYLKSDFWRDFYRGFPGEAAVASLRGKFEVFKNEVAR